ncbi:hypothetical protein BK720_04670 [Bacillus thuringiensis serovar brasilensis]|uniref:hypothetical protein n=1 Tax=Bacillus cereus group TaxID=86661 RepID=UPI000A37CBEA|nr:hypothetical protein [Bacillus thuringiensis]MRA93286.1 hypothetical protein [Bacillus thuringiensis]MRC55900.1 hypothetical protein [Bacillus thuringiensis]OTX37153.1 hypothetical protein BK720_04670 [Bacillus thuringiensis serovar brasilensis]
MLEQMLAFITQYSMWGLIASIIVLIVNLINANSVRKKSLRSFIVVEGLKSNPYSKDKILKEGARLILTEEYEKNLSNLREADNLDIKEANFYFLKIKNISSSPCFGMEIKFTLQDSLYKNEFKTINIYALESDEELYIPYPNDFITAIDYKIKKTEIVYTTVANEKLVYINETSPDGVKKVDVIQSMHVRKWCGDKKVVIVTGSNLDWEILK